jgi:hypothetical protein
MSFVLEGDERSKPPNSAPVRGQSQDAKYCIVDDDDTPNAFLDGLFVGIEQLMEPKN